MKNIFFNNYNPYKRIYKTKACIILFVVIILSGFGIKNIFAETSPSALYVPLIGITLVPEPLALPNGSGDITYNYAVKNFLKEVALTEIQIVDDTCSHITFVTGDDNSDSKLDYNETWRYSCRTKIFKTTESSVLVTGMANDIAAAHKAYATVVVGSNTPPPLVSIVNVTKVSYPLSLPANGGEITFTYKVNNPGVVPLSDVSITDNKCSAMSNKIGDTNGNSLLDTNEVWIYTCTTNLFETTTNTASVIAFANGLKAIGDTTLTVKVDPPSTVHSIPNLPFGQAIPSLPDTGVNPNLKVIVWGVLLGALVILVIFFIMLKKKRLSKLQKTEFPEKK
ncbi:MAG: LPXTG cell wall anchor domain-containing protein [Candidatus Paceibacterota bacterium]|jgi:LPXTG-motif cell wall-anchored protein